MPPPPQSFYPSSDLGQDIEAFAAEAGDLCRVATDRGEVKSLAILCDLSADGLGDFRYLGDGPLCHLLAPSLSIIIEYTTSRIVQQ